MYSFSQFFLKGYVEAGGGEYPHYLHIMAIIFLFNIGLMLLIGKLKPRKEAYVQQYTEQVDITQWKPVRLMGLIITVIVISTYFIFT
jgi:SSS family solute:Na+ symporter